MQYVSTGSTTRRFVSAGLLALLSITSVLSLSSQVARILFPNGQSRSLYRSRLVDQLMSPLALLRKLYPRGWDRMS